MTFTVPPYFREVDELTFGKLLDTVNWVKGYAFTGGEEFLLHGTKRVIAVRTTNDGTAGSERNFIDPEFFQRK